MKINTLYDNKKFTLSFEVFPPVREGNVDQLYQAIQELAVFQPNFISVTYGAGGRTRDRSIEIASTVKNKFQLEVLAHLTCVQATEKDIEQILESFWKENVENILALRGDPPEGTERFVKTEGGFGFACDLVSFIRSRYDFCIGVAGYPEGHPEAPSIDTDMLNLKSKVSAGADFIITQLFFNTDHFYRFRDRALAMDIQVPIIPGVFPIVNYSQVTRIISLSGAEIPRRFAETIDRVKDKPEEVEKYGVEYAIRQAEDLIRNEVAGLHLYCMNKSGPASRIIASLDLPRTLQPS
jgi:methylenetetrahydrofolate reductase (NADPH)